ncbi:hypothetical protein VQ042_16085 [Aurantimonas sp. A2-1-M11]|uniref:hypothetical protein n=1 Tax=Aurantimonas sp. A2-1-M11 TaxID=3113712 RepID=UPI002F9407FB
MRPILPIALMTALFAGCTSIPTRCYVTLDPGGGPTAEACETGPQLVIRPITETNAAYYVPPYVIAALSYEGFLVPQDADADAAGDEPDDGAAGAAAFDDGGASRWHRPDDAGPTPWRRTIVGTDSLAIAFASDDGVVTQDDLARFWDAQLMVTPIGAAPAAEMPENRLPQADTIDGEIRYRRPDALAGMAFPIASDLLP